jgi:hypothetical protein
VRFERTMGLVALTALLLSGMPAPVAAHAEWPNCPNFVDQDDAQAAVRSTPAWATVPARSRAKTGRLICSPPLPDPSVHRQATAEAALPPTPMSSMSMKSPRCDVGLDSRGHDSSSVLP